MLVRPESNLRPHDLPHDSPMLNQLSHRCAVYYASRRLSNAETRYSQFEKEALAVRWACQRFCLFLYGVDFEVCTDHKPLITVLSTKSTPPSARIERWLLYLQQFCYVVKHIAGVDNHADAFNRLLLDPPQSQDATETAEYAYSVAIEAIQLWKLNGHQHRIPRCS